MRLILFDIDQTLVYCAGAGLRCMGRAITEVTGVVVDAVKAAPDGKTDALILHEILTDAKAENGPLVAEEIWRRYEGYLTEEMRNVDARRCIKPGVPHLLTALASTPSVHLGLLTGNLEKTARIKLEPFDLNRFFPIGAFGSDAMDRCALGAIALERARRHFALDFQPPQVWVVGDTCRDVAAAKAIGARCLGVATGRASCDELRAGGADVAMTDLSDVAGALEILVNT